jgi:hypothetical protein
LPAPENKVSDPNSQKKNAQTARRRTNASTAVNQDTLRENATNDPADNKATAHDTTKLELAPLKQEMTFLPLLSQ